MQSEKKKISITKNNNKTMDTPRCKKSTQPACSFRQARHRNPTPMQLTWIQSRCHILYP